MPSLLPSSACVRLTTLKLYVARSANCFATSQESETWSSETQPRSLTSTVHSPPCRRLQRLRIGTILILASMNAAATTTSMTTTRCYCCCCCCSSSLLLLLLPPAAPRRRRQLQLLAQICSWCQGAGCWWHWCQSLHGRVPAGIAVVRQLASSRQFHCVNYPGGSIRKGTAL